jgi:hypothetical protein
VQRAAACVVLDQTRRVDHGRFGLPTTNLSIVVGVNYLDRAASIMLTGRGVVI